jgi:hypothetical protein
LIEVLQRARFADEKPTPPACNERSNAMYAQSTARQFAVAAVMVAALAGAVVAGIEPGGTGVVTSSRLQETTASQGQLPMLPEVVVTASRLEP